MKIKITDVNVEWIAKGKSKYGKASVSYTYNGEPRTQNIMSFANPDVFKTVQEMVGKEVEVAITKNAQNYTEWSSITVDGGSSSPANNTAVPNRTVVNRDFETREERAARQVLIVKQSSLSAAIDTLKTDKVSPNPDDVLTLAQKYTDWVFDNGVDDGSSGTV